MDKIKVQIDQLKAEVLQFLKSRYEDFDVYYEKTCSFCQRIDDISKLMSSTSTLLQYQVSWTCFPVSLYCSVGESCQQFGSGLPEFIVDIALCVFCTYVFILFYLFKTLISSSFYSRKHLICLFDTIKVHTCTLLYPTKYWMF
mgnify:FL=1